MTSSSRLSDGLGVELREVVLVDELADLTGGGRASSCFFEGRSALHVDRPHRPERLAVRAQQLVHAELGDDDRHHPLAGLEAERVGGLDLLGPQHRHREPGGVDAHREHVFVVVELAVHQRERRGIGQHLTRGEGQVVLLAQHAREVGFLQEAQLDQVGARGGRRGRPASRAPPAFSSSIRGLRCPVKASHGHSRMVNNILVGDVWYLTGTTLLTGEWAYNQRDENVKIPMTLPLVREFRRKSKASTFTTPRKRNFETGGGKYRSAWMDADFFRSRPYDHVCLLFRENAQSRGNSPRLYYDVFRPWWTKRANGFASFVDILQRREGYCSAGLALVFMNCFFSTLTPRFTKMLWMIISSK